MRKGGMEGRRNYVNLGRQVNIFRKEEMPRSDISCILQHFVIFVRLMDHEKFELLDHW